MTQKSELTRAARCIMAGNAQHGPVNGAAAHRGPNADADRVHCNGAGRDADASEAKADGGDRILEEIRVRRKEGWRLDGDGLVHDLTHGKPLSVLRLVCTACHGCVKRRPAAMRLPLQLLPSKDTVKGIA